MIVTSHLWWDMWDWGWSNPLYHIPIFQWFFKGSPFSVIQGSAQTHRLPGLILCFRQKARGTWRWQANKQSLERAWKIWNLPKAWTVTWPSSAIATRKPCFQLQQCILWMFILRTWLCPIRIILCNTTLGGPKPSETGYLLDICGWLRDVKGTQRWYGLTIKRKANHKPYFFFALLCVSFNDEAAKQSQMQKATLTQDW